jgi:glutaredoxin
MPNKKIKIEDQSFSIPSKVLYTCYGYEGCYFSESAASVLKEINSTKKKSIAKIHMINSTNTLKKKEELGKMLVLNTDIPKKYNTWPRIFHKGNFIGGYSELIEFLEK